MNSLRSYSKTVAPFAEKLAKRHGIPVELLLHTKYREPHIVRVRHELWSVAKDTLGLSLNETAKIFGVDHTSILHGVKCYRERSGLEAR